MVTGINNAPILRGCNILSGTSTLIYQLHTGMFSANRRTTNFSQYNIGNCFCFSLYRLGPTITCVVLVDRIAETIGNSNLPTSLLFLGYVEGGKKLSEKTDWGPVVLVQGLKFQNSCGVFHVRRFTYYIENFNFSLEKLPDFHLRVATLVP